MFYFSSKHKGRVEIIFSPLNHAVNGRSAETAQFQGEYDCKSRMKCRPLHLPRKTPPWVEKTGCVDKGSNSKPHILGREPTHPAFTSRSNRTGVF